MDHSKQALSRIQTVIEGILRFTVIKLSPLTRDLGGKAFRLNLLTVSLRLALLIVILIVFVPFSPKMPAPGLDPSWATGLNQAIAQGLAFGRDIIFTLGPYSSIYTKTYHPATDLMMIAGSCYLAFSYWFALILLSKTVLWRWSLPFFLFFLTMLYARDSLLLSYPLLVGLVLYKSEFTEKLGVEKSGYSSFIWIILFSPFALLSLIKGSFLLLSLALFLLFFLLHWANKQYLPAVLSLGSYLGFMLLFWVGAGQSLVNLPNYLLQTFSLAASFSEAMAIDGNQDEIIIYLLSATFLLLTILWQRQVPKAARFFLFSLFFAFLFISYKAGFVRHFGHSYIPSTSILLAALLFALVFNNRSSLLVLFAAVCSWAYINSDYTTISLRHNMASTLSSTWYGIKNRWNNEGWLKNNYALTMSYLYGKAPFPQLQGTTDIYSFEQTYLIASHNHWSPRPIFQSYSVFSPDLVEKNRKHLSAKQSPDHVIFKLEPIDNRVPSLEDGASWPLLIANYQPSQAVNDFLLLKRKSYQLDANKIMKLLISETHSLGENVKLPYLSQPVFAEIDIKPTLWGRLIAFLFKPEQLQIELILSDGSHKSYRLIASMAKTGFLVSPLIENTPEFALLYGRAVDLEAKRVKSFIISTSQENPRQWPNVYAVNFSRIETRFLEDR